jgi:hypothetical protein
MYASTSQADQLSFSDSAGTPSDRADLGITEISLSYYRDNPEDQWGNVQRWWSPIFFDDGSDSMSVDVFFQRLPE